MKIIGHLLNSEGPLLTILTDHKGGLFTRIHLNKFNTNLLVSTSFRDVISYIESKLTLREFITNSEGYSFEKKDDISLKDVPIDEIQSSISFIDNYYNELPNSMK